MKLRDFKHSKLFFVLWLVILICWGIFIFSNSLATAEESSETSRGVVEIIEEMVQKFIPEFKISDHFVRKLAHFIEFLILGLIFVSSYYLIEREMKYHICLTLLFGLLVSLTDETLQIFSDGRAAMVKDVWLDFSAVLTASLIFIACDSIVLCKKSL